MTTGECFEAWYSKIEEDYKKYKWLQWMNDIKEEYLLWYTDLREDTKNNALEWSSRDDEEFEKWALDEEYETFEDGYYEYKGDWVRELQSKWEDPSVEKEVISFTISFIDCTKVKRDIAKVIMTMAGDIICDVHEDAFVVKYERKLFYKQLAQLEECALSHQRHRQDGVEKHMKFVGTQPAVKGA